MSNMRWVHACVAVCGWWTLLTAIVLGQSPVFTTGTPAELERAQSLALDYLRPSVRQAAVELRPTRTTVDQISMAHVRVQQFYRGVPVFGGEAIAHLGRDGSLASVTDNLVETVDVDVIPKLTPDAAIQRASADAARPPGQPQGDVAAALWILRRGGRDHLAYRLQFPLALAPGPTRPVVFVDAHTGEVLLRYDNLQTEAPR